MTSLIDPTKPVQGNATTLSVRDNFQIAANEITALQTATANAAAVAAHLIDTANPHAVTAAQVGAPTSAAFATDVGNLATHVANTANPHTVTAAQVGSPTSAAFATDVGNLATHVADTANPHAVTAAQVGATVHTAGTPCVQNPYVVGTDTSQAHGLGAVPTFLAARLICLTAEFNYSIGDEIELPNTPTTGGGMGGGDVGLSFGCNATNVWVSTSAGRCSTTNKTTGTVEQITASRWKIQITPHKLT